MKMKTFLAATTAMAVVMSAPSASAGDLYISVFGGANWLSDSSGNFTSSSSGNPTETHAYASDSDLGFVIGGTIGTSLDRWANGLRVEVETSYRRNDLGGRWSETEDLGGSSTTFGGHIAGNASTFAIMANVWYEFDVGSKVRPYVGGGAGWARTRADAVFVTTYSSGSPATGTHDNIDQTQSGFAWQLGLGLAYEIQPNVDVGLGYRYFSGPKINPFFEGEGALDDDNHALQVELKIGIQ